MIWIMKAKAIREFYRESLFPIILLHYLHTKHKQNKQTETFEFVKSKRAFIAAKKIEDPQQISSARKEDDFYLVRHAEEGLWRREEDRDLAQGR